MSNDTTTTTYDTLTLEAAEALAEEVMSLTHLYSDDVRVMDDYSGRCMYGSTVIALVVPQSALTAIGYAAAKIGLAYDAVPTRTDNMGYDIVVY